MDIRSIISYNLRRLRNRAKLSQEDVADRYGCAASYISQLETGKVSLGREPADKLAAIYGVNKKEFIRVPPEIGDEALDEIWQNVYDIQQGDQAEVFISLVNLFKKVNAGEISPKAIEGLKKYIEVFTELGETQDD